MRIILLGTGCPAVHPERGGAAQLVAGRDAAALVDVGSGATQALVAAGLPGARLDALFVTHLHSDHLVDLYQLIVSSWHQGRDRPWRIFGPEGLRAFVDATMAVWAEERAQRIAFERRPSIVGLEVEVIEIGPGERVPLGDLVFTAVEVDHQPVAPAFGFIVEDGARKAVLSGDTRACAALIEAGRGADLLVHEVFLHREMTPLPGVRDADTIAAVASYHTLSSEVGQVARDMGAAALALTHFVPPAFDRGALLAEVAESYPGPIFVGEDGMAFDLATGEIRWRGLEARAFGFSGGGGRA
ncbi:MAG: MBL fold metallo-hydrolase [Pseudomonadota bacterium]